MSIKMNMEEVNDLIIYINNEYDLNLEEEESNYNIVDDERGIIYSEVILEYDDRLDYLINDDYDFFHDEKLKNYFIWNDCEYSSLYGVCDEMKIIRMWIEKVDYDKRS